VVEPPKHHRVAAHHGSLILAFGIASLVTPGFMALVFGPLAWYLGDADLKAMRAGRMDPSGESHTTTGRLLGIIAVGVHAGAMALALLVVVAILVWHLV
jgi:hypothetical protein